MQEMDRRHMELLSQVLNRRRTPWATNEIFVVRDRTTERLNGLSILLLPLRYEAK